MFSLQYKDEFQISCSIEILIQTLFYAHHLKEEMADELSEIIFSLGEHATHALVLFMTNIRFYQKFWSINSIL